MDIYKADGRKRIEWIDALRGIGLFFVVLGHSFGYRWDPVRLWIYSFHMPLFFFISGLTFRDESGPFLRFVLKKAKGLLLPYAAVNLFSYVIKAVIRTGTSMYADLSPLPALKGFVLGTTDDLPCVQSWFLPTLFIAEVLLFAIKRLLKKEWAVFAAALALGIAGSAVLSPRKYENIPWHADAALCAVLFVCLGSLFIKALPYFKRALENKLILIAVPFLAAGGAYLQTLNIKVSMNENRYGKLWIFWPSLICTVLALVILSYRVFKRSGLLTAAGRNSLFIFAYHAFFLSALKTYFPDAMKDIRAVLAAAVVDFCIMVPLARLLTVKTPVLVGKARRKN